MPAIAGDQRQVVGDGRGGEELINGAGLPSLLSMASDEVAPDHRNIHVDRYDSAIELGQQLREPRLDAAAALT